MDRRRDGRISFNAHRFHERRGGGAKRLVNYKRKKKVEVTIDEDDVVAIHRIPGREGLERPILIKLKNTDAKAKVMRKRSDLKKVTGGKIRLVDDVTKLNADLITALLAREEIESAWYFNGSVYGQVDGKRVKFDLLDDVDQKLKKKQK